MSRTTMLRIAVTPPGFDMMDELLQELGYQFEMLEDSELEDAELVSGFDVLFLNCSMVCFVYSAEVGPTLRRYVAQGGSIYASDFAGAYVQEAFPELFRCEAAGDSGVRQARVTDRGLKEILGDSIKLTFDLPGWLGITYLTKESRTYVVDRGTEKPLVVSFRYGEGQVVYTSFHNRAQTTEIEKKLLNFLVLKPLVALTSLRTETLVEGQAELLQEVPAFAQLTKPAVHHYYNSERDALAFVVNWRGQAQFRLRVWNPSGELVGAVATATPPCILRVSSAGSGRWKYEILPQSLPYPQFPYVASAGPENLLMQALSCEVTKARLVVKRAGRAGQEFPIDQESMNIGRWDASSGIFPEIDLSEDDPGAHISRKHARIFLKEGEYFIEDLGSTNGTFVNKGPRLVPGSPQKLQNGDEIIMGRTFFTFVIG